MRVFLTGATGLVGWHTTRTLRAAGVEVRCLQRTGSDTGHLEPLGCDIVRGDVLDPVEEQAWRMDGCDLVVHSAALVYSDASWERMRAVNVDGTDRVLRAAAVAGAARAVHVSSVVVYGDPGEFDGPLSPLPVGRWDGAPELPDSALYARSKRLAEEAVVSVAGETGLPIWTLRPSGVYGEWDRGLSFTLERMLRWPLTPMVGPGDNTVPMIYAGSVAEAVARCLEGAGSPGAYDLGSDAALTQRDAMEALARGIGQELRLVSVPPSLATGIAFLFDRIRSTGNGGGGPSLSRVVRLATLMNPYGSRRARDELGWRPSLPPEVGLERTGAWLANRRRKESESDRGPGSPTSTSNPKEGVRP